jgi:hypothetical protein
MAKHLTTKNIEYIVNVIRGWSEEKLTWEGVCERVALTLDSSPNRQTLFKHKPIREAFVAKKKGLKINPRLPAPSSLSVAAKTIARLRAEISELKLQNSAQDEQFLIWQYNAYKYGLTETKLNEPLPQIDRERTDGETR